MDRKIRAQKIPWPGDFNPQSQSVGQGDDHRSLPRIRSRYNRLRFESCGWCWKVPGRANGIRPLIILGNCEANHQIHRDVFLQVLPQSNSGDQKRVMFFNVFRWIQTNISADADQNMSTVADSCFIPWTAILQSSNRGREIISKVLLDHSSTVLKAVSMVRRKRKVLGSMLCWFLSQSCNRIKENYTRKLGRPKAARSIRSMGPQIKQIKEIKRSSVRSRWPHGFSMNKKSMTSPWVISEPGHRAICWDEKGPCQKVGISGIRFLAQKLYQSQHEKCHHSVTK